MSRVGRAACVLQQQRVEDRGPARFVESDRFGEAHADDTASLGVAPGLAFGDVQGVREPRQHLRQPYLNLTCDAGDDRPLTALAKGRWDDRCEGGQEKTSSCPPPRALARYRALSALFRRTLGSPSPSAMPMLADSS